jgi:hypothetical protein
METTSTLRTLELLADGRDPATGLALPDTSPYNQPAVVRSLFAAIRALELTTRPAEEQTALGETTGRAIPARTLPANAGKPWTSSEDETLCTAFDQGVAIKDLAVRHGRSTTALNARLFKLGKIADPGIPLRHPVNVAARSNKQGDGPSARAAGRARASTRVQQPAAT